MTEPTSAEIEVIKHAAVISFNRKWFIGKCHADCFAKAHFTGVKMSQKAEDQGFITSKGRFVTRREAAELALAAGQIDKPTSLLFSEDLWSRQYNGKFIYDEIKGYLARDKELNDKSAGAQE